MHTPSHMPRSSHGISSDHDAAEPKGFVAHQINQALTLAVVNMAGFYLVPIPIAVPLSLLIVALIPLTPLAWACIACRSVIRGIQQQERLSQTARSTVHWIALSFILPPTAVLVLWLMVLVQLILAPLVLLQQLRKLHETIIWLSTRWPLSPLQSPTTPQPPNTTDLCSLQQYEYSPLPPRTIRLLTLHPGPSTSPLAGNLTTTPLPGIPSRSTYTVLAYTRAPGRTATQPPSPNTSQSCLLLSQTHPSTSTYHGNPWTTTTTQSWTTLSLTSPCAAALRNLRSETEAQTLWVEEVCVDQGDDEEKSRLGMLGMGERVLGCAREVVVDTTCGSTGEEDGEVEGLFGWVDALRAEELVGVPEGGRLLGGMAVGSGGGLRREVLAGILGCEKVELLERAWGVGRVWWRRARVIVGDEYRASVLGLAPAVPVPRPLAADRALRAYFGPGRVWPLQEVLLPELSRVRFVYSGKSIGGERMAHLASLLSSDSASEMVNGRNIFRLFRPPALKSGLRRSHLLDVLIQTRDRRCEDPRNKILDVLAIARRLDGGALMSNTRVDYRNSVAEVYGCYSAELIRWHGPGFFLSLIKSSPEINGLPSWSADWTVPWPNQRALPETEYAARSKAGDEKDRVVGFEADDKSGRMIMKIMRPRIVRGFFTRDGHIDGAERTHIENVRQLGRDEILVEISPGLALLLRQVRGGPECFTVVRTCPHALSRAGVAKVVRNWSSVVFGQDVGRDGNHEAPSKVYLSLSRVYNIV